MRLMGISSLGISLIDVIRIEKYDIEILEYYFAILPVLILNSTCMLLRWRQTKLFRSKCSEIEYTEPASTCSARRVQLQFEAGSE